MLCVLSTLASTASMWQGGCTNAGVGSERELESALHSRSTRCNFRSSLIYSDAYVGSFRKKSTLLSLANGFMLIGANDPSVNHK